MKIKLLLTFDHELPLGGMNTSYENALFAPTQKVLDIANKTGVKVTLFSDILCAYQYKKWDTENFYSPYKNQLEHALSTGHDVQLHIHPHWLTTTYQKGTFLPSNDFTLSNFKVDMKFGGIPGIIKLSIDELNTICKAADKNYKCIAYRAGGYNIYPETELIFDSLYQNGIRYDSSMAKGFYFKSSISQIDFKELPKKANWMINSKNYHSELNETGILEIPIATMPKTPFEIPTRFKLRKYAHRAVENRGRVIHTESQIDLKSKIRMLFTSRMLSFDNHTLSLDYLLRVFKYNVRNYKNVDEIMLSIISHPKSMGDYSFELMEKFIDSIQKQYPDVDFVTYQKIHQYQNKK